MNKLAFIGGTGVYNPEILTDLHSETIETPYGTAKYELGYFKAFSISLIVIRPFNMPLASTKGSFSILCFFNISRTIFIYSYIFGRLQSKCSSFNY